MATDIIVRVCVDYPVLVEDMRFSVNDSPVQVREALGNRLKVNSQDMNEYQIRVVRYGADTVPFEERDITLGAAAAQFQPQDGPTILGSDSAPLSLIALAPSGLKKKAPLKEKKGEGDKAADLKKPEEGYKTGKEQCFEFKDPKIIKWIVPTTAHYEIEAHGGAGGLGRSNHRGGLGAIVKGVFPLQGKQEIFIIVGEKGMDFRNQSNGGGGGGGGTFVYTNYNSKPTLLLAAGGGGGGSYQGGAEDGKAEETGGTGGYVGNPTQAGMGGYADNGGGGGCGAGGAGWKSVGTSNQYCHGGSCISEGDPKGGNSDTGNTGGNGGWGGGGGAMHGGGGGGGYTGGNGGSYNVGGGGGGSYCSNRDWFFKTMKSTNAGNGKLKIRALLENESVKRLSFNLDNVFDKLASNLGEDDLEIALQFVDVNAAACFEREEFKKMSHALLYKVISRDSLNLPEADVLAAVVKWGHAECDRKGHPSPHAQPVLREAIGDEVVNCLRFSVLPIKDFVRVVASAGLLNTQELLRLYAYYAASEEERKTFDLPWSAKARASW